SSGTSGALPLPALSGEARVIVLIRWLLFASKEVIFRRKSPFFTQNQPSPGVFATPGEEKWTI
ncbi:MAG: hypothetical protein LUC47_03600, partial [Clostridiales bacterium]|nr:hypothetical protein [Clostridiales bacterium]